MEREKRPSVYLEEKCHALSQVLDFFSAPPSALLQSLDEKLVVFLSQLEFWEWELDNLIYSFTTFVDRVKAWDQYSGRALVDSLKGRGIPVRVSAVKNLNEKRMARKERVRQVEAPAAQLNDVIEKWNNLLRACEQRVLVPEDERQRSIQLGAQFLPDLSRYRKAVLEIHDE
jgi:hypothetical protein